MRPLPAGASMSAPVSLSQNPIKMDSHARRSCPPLPFQLPEERRKRPRSAALRASLVTDQQRPPLMSAHVRTCLQISGAMPGASLELPGAVRPSEISAHAYRTMRTHEGIKKRGLHALRNPFLLDFPVLFLCWFFGVSLLVLWCFGVGFLVFWCWFLGVLVLAKCCSYVGRSLKIAFPGNGKIRGCSTIALVRERPKTLKP